MLLECRTVKETSRALNNKKIKSNSVTQFSQISNEQLKSDVFSRLLKTDSDGDAVTSDGRLFQTRAAATDGDTTRWWNVQLERRSGTKSPSRVRVCHTAQFSCKIWRSHASNGRQVQRA